MCVREKESERESERVDLFVCLWVQLVPHLARERKYVCVSESVSVSVRVSVSECE